MSIAIYSCIDYLNRTDKLKNVVRPRSALKYSVRFTSTYNCHCRQCISYQRDTITAFIRRIQQLIIRSHICNYHHVKEIPDLVIAVCCIYNHSTIFQKSAGNIAIIRRFWTITHKIYSKFHPVLKYILYLFVLSLNVFFF